MRAPLRGVRLARPAPSAGAGSFDAVVVGAGPNGLAAAITLAEAGCTVKVIEAAETIGGGVRSAALTQPGFLHDVCSAVYPLGIGSPFFRSLPLADQGLEWLTAEVPLAHPLDGGRAVVVRRALDETAAELGPDGGSYARAVGGLVEIWRALLEDVERAPRAARLAFPSLWSFRALATLARAAPLGFGSAARLIHRRFSTEEGRALIAGLSAHGTQPLTRRGTGGFALTLGAAAHAVGWPIVRGGAQRLTEALAAVLRRAGGEIEIGRRVRSLADLPASRVTLFDLAPEGLRRIAAGRFPARYDRRLARHRRGPGTFKIDYALARPIPWTAAPCRQAAVIHVGGTADEIATALAETEAGAPAARPFVLVAQPSLLDRSRVPTGSDGETAWAYCHVPNGCEQDMTGPIEAQIERFAPGFRDVVLDRHVVGPSGLEAENPNLVGGDIGGGACHLGQLLLGPAFRLIPWTTPAPSLFLCSASTPPGPGVHGLCGHFAARAALRALRR